MFSFIGCWCLFTAIEILAKTSVKLRRAVFILGNMNKMVISLYLSPVTKIAVRLDTMELKAGTVERAALCVC